MEQWQRFESKPGQFSNHNQPGVPLSQSNYVREPAAQPSASYEFDVRGYENVSFDRDNSAGLPPPDPSSAAAALDPAVVQSSMIPAITDDEAKKALGDLVQRNCCWRSRPVKLMAIKGITPTNAYHYTLESFTEGRSTRHTSVPFKGECLDGPFNGPAPMPWDVPCAPSAMFKSETLKIPVPHTDMVNVCHLCSGSGFNRCSKCTGRGDHMCGDCGGKKYKETADMNGEIQRSRCERCDHRGMVRCQTCQGNGTVVCSKCMGSGKMKQFIQLTVVYTNRKSDHIIEKTDLPDHLIAEVKGQQIFQQTQFRVRPIENFIEGEINQKSSEMVNTHASSWPAERILQQRHLLRSVPVHECHFEYKQKGGRFWVYGQQREAYTEEYPETCCCVIS